MDNRRVGGGGGAERKLDTGGGEGGGVGGCRARIGSYRGVEGGGGQRTRTEDSRLVSRRVGAEAAVT